METLEAELDRARALDAADLADSIEAIGFECTRCGACCKAVEGRESEPGEREADGAGNDADETGNDVDETGNDAGHEHVATVFPDEVRDLQRAAAERSGDGAGDGEGDGDDERGIRGEETYDWRDVARPMPYGLSDGPDGPAGETFEWALQTDDCGDCTFYAEDGGTGRCTVHDDRPLVCRTYPFSVALGGTSQPMGEAVDEAGLVRAHECEGLGRDISRADAETLARTLRARAIRELEEAIAVRDGYAPVEADRDEVVVHDSEGAKRPDGSRFD